MLNAKVLEVTSLLIHNGMRMKNRIVAARLINIVKNDSFFVIFSSEDFSPDHINAFKPMINVSTRTSKPRMKISFLYLWAGDSLWTTFVSIFFEGVRTAME